MEFPRGDNPHHSVGLIATSKTNEGCRECGAESRGWSVWGRTDGCAWVSWRQLPIGDNPIQSQSRTYLSESWLQCVGKANERVKVQTAFSIQNLE